MGKGERTFDEIIGDHGSALPLDDLHPVDVVLYAMVPWNSPSRDTTPTILASYFAASNRASTHAVLPGMLLWMYSCLGDESDQQLVRRKKLRSIGKNMHHIPFITCLRVPT